MEPFSITCHSCAARLKVARPELIEQTLACPKCGSMIHVQHPTGWKPPIPESKGSQSALSSIVSGNDFDQIDDLLPQPGDPARRAKTVTDSADRKSQAKPNSTKARFQQPIPTADAAARRPSPNQADDPSLKDQPILPGQQWANPSAQKRKKLMLMIGSAIGTVVLVAIAIATIVQLSGTTPNNDPGQVAATDPVGDSLVPNKPGGNQAVSPTEDSTTKPDAEAEQPDGFLDNAPTVTQLPIEQKNAIGAAPPIGSPDSGTNGFAAPELAIPTEKTGISDSPTPQPTPEPVDAAASVAPVKLKDLQDVLAESGISVSELEDVTLMLRSFEEARNPKFPMERPKTKNFNFQRALTLPIRKLESPDGISLARAARTLTLLSGVPVAVDTRQLSMMGLPANPTLQLALKDETTLSAAEKIAELAGAKAAVVGDGIFISLPADEKNTAIKIAFPNVGDLTDEEKQRFLNSIQALIAPDIWTRPEAPATISFEGETISLNASLGVQRHVQMLIERINAAAELAADPGNEKAAATVTSRWSASKGLRSEPSRWTIGPELTLANFLNRIERKNGLTVIVDWPAVLAAGWTPLTMVPGELVETKVGDAIHQLAKAMNLKIVGIDAKTLQLTTSEVANGIQDLEVYPLLTDWAAETAPTELEQLIFNALGRQVQTSFIRVVYEPKCSCIIVVAPQPIQRQVAKLVERLNRVDSAALEDR